MAKAPLAMDERNVETVRKVCTVMYGATMVLLALAVFFRQFVLGGFLRFVSQLPRGQFQLPQPTLHFIDFRRDAFQFHG